MEFNGVRNDMFIVDVNAREKSPFQPRALEFSRLRLRKTEKELLEISQPVTFKAFDNQEKVNKIKQLGDWLISDGWGSLSFDDEPGRYYSAIFNGADSPERIGNSPMWTVNLHFIANATLGETKQISVTTTDSEHTITGQESTPWSIEVLFKENTSRFEAWFSDNYLQLNYDFVEGDRLTINYTGREVWLRDVDLRKAVSMTSNFAELKPGMVSMRASHPCTLKYTERYY